LEFYENYEIYKKKLQISSHISKKVEENGQAATKKTGKTSRGGKKDGEKN